MRKVRRVSVYGALILAFAQTVGAQENQAKTAPPKIEASSQPAVDKLREIARTIRECPAAITWEISWGKEPLEILRMYAGPPMNVVWDVVPSKTVRSPYAGYIEFSIHDYPRIPKETQAKHMRQYPGLYLETITRLTKDWKFRYEFDVGPHGVELSRALSRPVDASDWGDRGGDNEKGGFCWDNAARSGQTAATTGKQ